MVLVEFWINHAKGGDLSLVVNSKRAGENNAWRKSRHKIVEINNRAAPRPQESARSQRAAGLAHHLAEIVDAESFSVMAALQTANRTHPGVAVPHKCLNALHVLGGPNHHSMIINVVGAAAG